MDENEFKIWEIDEDGCVQTWVAARTALEALTRMAEVQGVENLADVDEMTIRRLSAAQAAVTMIAPEREGDPRVSLLQEMHNCEPDKTGRAVLLGSTEY